MSHRQNSCGDSLSPRSAEISIRSLLAGPCPPGKSQTHIAFLSVTSCICCVLELGFSGQMWKRTCGVSPLGTIPWTAPSGWAVQLLLLGAVPFFFLFWFLNLGRGGMSFILCLDLSCILFGRAVLCILSRYFPAKGRTVFMQVYRTPLFLEWPLWTKCQVCWGGLLCVRAEGGLSGGSSSGPFSCTELKLRLNEIHFPPKSIVKSAWGSHKPRDSYLNLHQFGDPDIFSLMMWTLVTRLGECKHVGDWGTSEAESRDIWFWLVFLATWPFTPWRSDIKETIIILFNKHSLAIWHI